MKQNQIILKNGKYIDIGASLAKTMGKYMCKCERGAWVPVCLDKDVERVYMHSRVNHD